MQRKMPGYGWILDQRDRRYAALRRVLAALEPSGFSRTVGSVASEHAGTDADVSAPLKMANSLIKLDLVSRLPFYPAYLMDSFPSFWRQTLSWGSHGAR